MKRCPYCAEEIQDEAILCRYCKSDLAVPPPAGAPGAQPEAPSAPAEPGAPPPEAAAPPVTSPTEDEGPGIEEKTGARAESAKPVEVPTSSTSERRSTPAEEEPKVQEETKEERPAAAAAGAAAAAKPGTAKPDTAEGFAFGPGTSAGAAQGAATTGGETASPGGEPEAQQVTYTHSGYRYVLGYGPDFFGIWDRQAPTAAAERFPRTDDGWRQVWQRFAALEPNAVEVGGGAAAGPIPAQAAPPQAAGVPAGATVGDGQALQYTHSGQRYLLGYGPDFFGIWDRGSLTQPVQRYPRTDEGWRAAWQQFAAWEPHSVEVGLGGNS